MMKGNKMEEQELIEDLKVAFASTYAFYLKAQYYHWNIEGPDFPQYHEFFGNLYQEVGTSIDRMAEHIRALDAYTPGSFKRLEQLSVIKGDDTIPTGLDMAARLLEDNNKLTPMLISVMKKAEAVDRYGTANFIQDRIEAHRLHAWMLKATLKK
jgi:starvation-inducible DNA-binding protein